jgi:hypothetical protein
MSISAFFRGALLGALLVGAGGFAQAQSAVSPRQIQEQIASGQTQLAIGELHQVLQSHPGSGVAWYLTAEAQDAAGHAAAARDALSKAEHFAPGLPFAKPAEVAALRAHLAQPEGGRAGHGGISPVWLILGGFVLLFILLRLFGLRRRMRAGYQPGFDGYANRPAGPGPYGSVGPGPYGPVGPGSYGPGYGPGPGMQAPGMGSSLMTGLAAGAGFAAGERIIDGLDGANRGREFGQNVDQGQNFDPMPPDRDDGLQGSPDWNDNSDDNFDPNNSW